MILENRDDFKQITGHAWSLGKGLSWYFRAKAMQIRDSRLIFDRMHKTGCKYSNITIHHYGYAQEPFQDYQAKPNKLYFAEVGDFSNGKPIIVLMAGVHGYEPSGVMSLTAALEKNELQQYQHSFNFAVFPLVTPFAFDYDQRYNAFARDVNRVEPMTMEMMFLLKALEKIGQKGNIALILDKHETPHKRDKELRIVRSSMEGKDAPSEAEANKFVNGIHMMITQSDDKNVLAQRKEFAWGMIDSVSYMTPVASNDVIAGYENDHGVVVGAANGSTGRIYMQNRFPGMVMVPEVVPDILSGGYVDNDPAMGYRAAQIIQSTLMHTAIRQARTYG